MMTQLTFSTDRFLSPTDLCLSPAELFVRAGLLSTICGLLSLARGQHSFTLGVGPSGLFLASSFSRADFHFHERTFNIARASRATRFK